jgi:two-component system cell cycle sensor histidine kinase/response regulator CckA
VGVGTDEWDGIYWRALVEASPDIVLVVDREGTILFVNRVAPVFADRGIIGHKLWDFAVGDAVTRLTKKLAEVTASRKAVVYENAGLRGDGSPGWYEVRAIPVVVDSVVERVLWASSDISERKHLEAQVRQSQKMEAIGLLAGGVAHDFNNLLAVIMGFGDLAVRSVPPGHPVEEQLREVLDAARRGGELTRKLLAFSRKQIIQPRRIDVGATVGDFARVMQRILGEDIELHVDNTPAPVMVHADPAQLEQLLMNLWTNARQAMPGGGRLRLSVRSVELDAKFASQRPSARAGSFGEICVRDTGLGMDESTLARIFEPFFTTKDEGTGLGLATVYGIVQQHGGFLHVESVRGAGTTVYVYLPRADTAVPATTVPSSLAAEAPRGDEIILFAEDEPSLRALVATTLGDLGYRVITARDGEEALREFERHAPEVVLAVLDVVMPRLNAREVYERMRVIRPNLKVLFTTGYAPSSAGLADLFEAEAVPILEKPFTPFALATSVRRAIDTPARG